MSQLKYWVWLSMRFGVRPKVKLALVEHFGTPRDVYFATEADYRVRASLRPEELRLLLDKDLHEAERALAICDREDIRALTIQDAAYPQRLLQIYDPPLVLYVRGTLPPLDDRAAVAVVGTRSATPYGMRTAHKLGSEIVRHGGIVLSGLTAGIDRSAAEGALDAGGVCVGVSGTAINLDFAGACTQSVARCGAVVSEFAPNMSVPRFGFRLRNRITSGLAVATVVVEAPEKSGALLFAEDAITQGREVFAVPGNADSHASVGSNALLKDGARPATCAWDVLGDFRRMFPGTLHERIVRLRAIHDKVRDAIECHAHGLHVRPIGRLHRARQRHHRGRLPRRCVRHDRLNAFRPADLGKNAGFPLRAGAQRMIKPRAAQGVAAKFTAHHLQPDLPAAARRGQKSGLFNAQLRQAQQLRRDARALRGQHVREYDGRDVARRIEHRDFIFPFHFSGLHGGHSVKWTWLLM